MKQLSKILIFLLIFSIILTGCNSTQMPDTSTEETTTLPEETPTTDPNGSDTPDDPFSITIAEAIELGASKAHNTYTEDKYYVTGVITEIYNTKYGNMKIKDSDGNIFTIYGTFNSDGTIRFDSMTRKPAVDETVTVYGIIGQYNGTPQMKNGWIMNIQAIGGGDHGGGAGNQGSSGGGSSTSDPYANMSAEEFYASYTPATSYTDAYYRSLHGFMSGSIEDQYKVPTVSDYQPTQNGLFVRNDSAIYSEDGNTYYVLDAYGEVAFEIYRGGGYVTLEEVAAYIFAFGDIPANYVSSKKTSPQDSVWGKYLRLNHNSYSNNVTNYPYEPELPNTCRYMEIDIGTTGSGNTTQPYNNGTKITRGAARIVYARFDANGNKIIEAEEKFVFYTYNHYNDFQEYLNYEGGWGERFGNETGGGRLDDKYYCNPTPYVATARAYFATSTTQVEYESLCVYYIDTRSLYYATQMCA